MAQVFIAWAAMLLVAIETLEGGVFPAMGAFAASTLALPGKQPAPRSGILRLRVRAKQPVSPLRPKPGELIEGHEQFLVGKQKPKTVLRNMDNFSRQSGDSWMKWSLE